VKTYAIADLHGRFDLLCQAISLIENDCKEPGRLVIMGDFIDRGPQSRNIIDLLMAGPSLPNWEWIVLQGNHEEMMLRSITTTGLLNWWLRNGGGATLKSYGYNQGDNLLPLKMPEEHLQWIADLPITFEDNHRIFVHAGVPYNRLISDVNTGIMQWMLYEGYDYYDTDTYPDQPHISGKHIVHGHQQSAAHPLLLPHRTNLDSFA
jgi:serine/threonine protein phosphatase 1